MEIQVFQHVTFEGPARIETWAKARGHRVNFTRFFEEDAPDLHDEVTDLLVVMGGTMGARDDAKFPWMKPEKKALERALKRGTRVLGVCLGAQLLADVLGARVYPNREKEIGWWPIQAGPSAFPGLELSSSGTTVFHWHGDTFDLPAGAAHLARSAACENQAFSWGKNAIGLQFHLEVGITEVNNLIRHGAGDWAPGRFVQSASKIAEESPTHVLPLQGYLDRMLDHLTKV